MHGISLDRTSTVPVARQLATALRAAIHDGSLAGGERLLSSRRLAEELGLSRRLVAEVYDQLASEGYLRARQGSGTEVVDGLAMAASAQARQVRSQTERPPERPSRIRWDFTAGIPDLDGFPRKAWMRAMDRALSFASARELSYGPAAGDGRLRQAIAAYLQRQRGMAPDPERIVLGAGTAGCLDLLTRAAAWSEAWCEDPGLGYARANFRDAGLVIRDLAVDSQGADPVHCQDMAMRSLVYLTPSHQFPTGALLPVPRRIQFLDLARRRQALVVEDDYDSEFRLRTPPVPPIWQLGPEQVLYLGSYSKVLAPFLRLSYMIAPDHLVEPLLERCRTLNIRGSLPSQRALAYLLEDGVLDAHVYRQRKELAKRLDIVERFIVRHWSGQVSWSGNATGSHLYLRFSDRSFDDTFFATCERQGLRLIPPAGFHARTGGTGKDLLLGYANIKLDDLEGGLSALAGLVDGQRPKS